MIGILALDALIGGTGAPIGSGSDPQAVAAVQDLLRGHGFARMPGPQDKGRGLFGPATTQAAADFCQARGLPPRIDQQGLLALINFPAATPVVSQAFIVYVLGMNFTAETKLVALLTRVAGAGRFADVLTNLGKGGLGAGILPWVQRTKALNALLKAFDQSHELLKRIFGTDDNVKGLLNHTALANGGLDAGGHTTNSNFDLVGPPWTSQFRLAGHDPVLQAVQVEAARLQFDTWFKTSISVNMPILTSERGVALALDLIMQFGVAGAEDIYKQATTAAPDAIVLNRMRDVSIDRLQKQTDFVSIPQIAQAAQARRNFLLTTQLLSDNPFVPDGVTTPGPAIGRLPRYFLPLGHEPFQLPVRGTTATRLILAEEAFPKMVKDIKSASVADGFIYMLNWYCNINLELDDNHTPSSLNALLTEAAAKGAEIRALFWAGPVGELGDARREFPPARKWLDEYAPSTKFNTEARKRINELPSDKVLALTDQRTRDYGTHHQKLLVVGKGGQLIAAYVGGIEYDANRKISSVPDGFGSPLFDFTVRLEDRAAWLALQMFKLRWSKNVDSNPTELGAKAIPMPTAPGGNLIVQMTQTRGQDDAIPAGIRTAMAAIVNAIGQANKYFYIEDQYFVGNELLAAAIFNAFKRSPSLNGIIVMTPDEDVTDFHDATIAPVRRCLFLRSIERLFSGFDDKDLAHLQGRLLMFERLGDGGTPAGKYAYVHSKLVIIDDEAALFGSVNMNHRSWSHDTEIYATVVDTMTPAGTAVNNKGWVHDFRCDMWKRHFGKDCDGDIDKDIAVWQEIFLKGTIPNSSVRKYNITEPFPDTTSLEDIYWSTILDPA